MVLLATLMFPIFHSLPNDCAYDSCSYISSQKSTGHTSQTLIFNLLNVKVERVAFYYQWPLRVGQYVDVDRRTDHSFTAADPDR